MRLGAEMETCADTLAATIGRSREAIRIGLFHLGFNIVSVAVWGALAMGALTAFIRWSSGDPPSRSRPLTSPSTRSAPFLCFASAFGALLECAVPDREAAAAASRRNR